MKTITNREKEILTLIADGHSSKEIALQLQLSIYTIETHRKNLISKFNVRNSAQLIRDASRAALI